MRTFLYVLNIHSERCWLIIRATRLIPHSTLSFQDLSLEVLHDRFKGITDYATKIVPLEGKYDRSNSNVGSGTLRTNIHSVRSITSKTVTW